MHRLLYFYKSRNAHLVLWSVIYDREAEEEPSTCPKANSLPVFDCLLGGYLGSIISIVYCVHKTTKSRDRQSTFPLSLSRQINYMETHPRPTRAPRRSCDP